MGGTSGLDPKLHSMLSADGSWSTVDGVACFAVPSDATHERWDEAYEHSANAENDADDAFTAAALALIGSAWAEAPYGTFLELGCGEMKIGARLAQAGAEVVGLDFSMPALQEARARLERLGLPVRLVQADIRETPFRENTFDAIYGGGVIEHVRELDAALVEMHRITRGGGITINTIPYLSVGAVTYRQVWGNIPAVPGVRQVAELVHIHLLRGRHMRFGYERSYSMWTLRRAFRRAGFIDVRMARYDVPLVFEYLPYRVRGIASRLARQRLFWPMISVAARKP